MGVGALHVDEQMYNTGHRCTDGDCGEHLMAAEVVMLLQIVLPSITEQHQVTFTPFTRPDGTFAYEPYFFHDGCWVNMTESLSELLEEYDCVPDQDPYSYGTCSACGHGLRMGEPLALIQMGEFHNSERQPEGHAHKFKPYPGSSECLCLSCIRAINDEVLEMWPSVSFAGECPACTYQRNWRDNVPCTHEVETDE